MARDRTDRFTIPYSGDNPACSLLVVFAPTRTAVLETIASTEPPNNAPEISWYDHYLALQWPASWRPCSVTILVTYRGERLLHQETLWCEPGQDVQLRVQQLIECRGQQIEEQDFLDAIPGIEGSTTFKRYFYDLDSATNTLLRRSWPGVDTTERDFRCCVLRDTTRLLWERVKCRCQRTGEGDIQAASESLPSRWIAYLSALQIGLIRNHFGRERCLDVDQVRWAHQVFAGGSLTEEGRGINFRPNSTNVFLFAEFSFIAIERRVDRDFWLCLAPALTSMQPIFCETYPNLEPGADREAERLSLDRIQQIALQYAGLSLDEARTAATQNACDILEWELP